MVAGDVVQRFGGGSFLVSVGKHRVPARSAADLQAGRRYLFEVLRNAEALELRVVGELEAGDAPLLRALRAVLGAERPLGPMLQQLLRELEAAKSSPGRAAEVAERLARAVRERVFEPGGTAEDLASKLRANGTSYEGRWARAAFDHSPRGALERFTHDLAQSLTAQWVAFDSQGASHFRLGLRAALRELFTSAGATFEDAWARWSAGAPAGDLPARAEDLLRRALERWPDAAQRALLIERLRALGLERLPHGVRVALVGALAGAQPPQTPAGAESLDALAQDLKAELLRARSELDAGPLRTAVERALANLEAEQLVNVARHGASESSHWSLPVPDGARWTTAHLFVHRDRDRRSPRRGDDACHERISVTVEFSSTGPLHVDLLLKRDALAVRVLASSEKVASALRGALAELEQHLALGGRAVQSTVAVVPAGQLRAEDGVRDSRFLAEHHVMDVTG
jgi:hypothetical protein